MVKYSKSEESKDVKGIDTIIQLDHKLGQSIEIPWDIIRIGQRTLEHWYSFGMAFIPYCVVCKEPLVFHLPASTDLLFSCPKCNREWRKDNGWLIKEMLHEQDDIS